MPTPRTGFELRDHTADVALYVWGDTMEALFGSAAEGLYAVIGELQPVGAPTPIEITLTAADRADLLCDFLSELLFIFETSRARVIDIQFHELTESRVIATGRRQSLDVRQSHFDAEVKAVTHHNLEIEATTRGFETTIILDI